MLKRSCPRFSSASSTANGRSLTVALSILPVKNASSSWSVPRATVPSTSGRALEPSAKNALARSPRYFGWLCMSCRQPVRLTRQSPATTSTLIRLSTHLSLRVGPHPHALSLGGAPSARSPPAPRSGRRRFSQPPVASREPRAALFLDVIDFPCPEALQKCARAHPVEFRIGCLDREEEPVLTR